MLEDEFTDKQIKEAMFIQIVFMFQAAAMQQMGKIVNPLTQKVERDMEQAKNSIDLLGMIQEKTKGNLNEKEQRIIDQALFGLRMNYLDEIKKGEGREKEKAGVGEEGEQEGSKGEKEKEDKGDTEAKQKRPKRQKENKKK